MKKFIYTFHAMSTDCEIILYSKEKQSADFTAKAVLAEVKRLEKKYNYYQEDSLLSQINARNIQEIDLETKSILQRAKQYYKLTDTLFDITVATIKELYRNEKNEQELQIKKEKLEQYIGCEHFQLKKNKIIFDNIYTKIDLGGFVKEYSVDKSIQIIKKNKIKSALINYGGDIYALGRKPDKNKFIIGIKDPSNKIQTIKEIEIEDEALTTSASYERSYTIGKRNFSHILSKTTLEKAPRSVTVIAKNCVESGIYSTSLMLNPKLTSTNEVFIVK